MRRLSASLAQRGNTGITYGVRGAGLLAHTPALLNTGPSNGEQDTAAKAATQEPWKTKPTMHNVTPVDTIVNPDRPLNKGQIWGAIKDLGLIAQLQLCTEINLPKQIVFSVLWDHVKDTPILTWLHEMDNVPESALAQTEAALVSLLEANGAMHAACVVKFLTQPRLPTSIPVVEEFLKGALRHKKQLLKDHGDATDDATHDRPTPLVAYLEGLVLTQEGAADQRAASALASDIEALPRRYRARANVLFAATLKDTAVSCARLVWEDAARQEEAANGVLEGIGKYTGEAVVLSDNSSSEGDSSNTPQPDVSFEELNTREWPRGFVKDRTKDLVVFLTYTGETNESMQINKDTKFALMVLEYDSMPAVQIIVKNGTSSISQDFQTMKELDAYLECLVRPLPPLNPPLPPLFDNITYDEFAVGYRGGPATPMSQLDKQGVSLVQGDSGTGKTTFACQKLPKMLGRKDPIVCRVAIEVDNAIERINQAHEDHMRTLKDMDDQERFRRLFCLAALRWRTASLPDEDKYPAWRLYCMSNLRADTRDSLATSFVIKTLKTALRSGLPENSNYNVWFETTGVAKAGSVVLVLDEIGKSLALARAIISARYMIFTHEWVLSHLSSLDLVLCGTGAELSLPGPDLPVATDPSAVHCVEMTTPDETFVEKQFANALYCPSPKVLPTRNPMLYAQYLSSPLFSAAKENMRLFLLTRRILHFLWRGAATAEAASDRVAHVDATLASSLGLDRIVTLALLFFPTFNGLKRAGMSAKRAMDATLVEALADTSRGTRYRSVIPVMPLHQHQKWLDEAASLGLVVRKPGDRPSAPMTALVAFAFSSPGKELDGYALEKFTAQWASRLVQVQCGYTSAPRPLECHIPWKSNNTSMKPNRSEIRDMVKLLAEHKVLVVMNGPNAPGADVIVLQLRPSYSQVSDQMTLEGYRAVWRRRVMAIMTLISAKRTGESFRRQLEGTGVVRSAKGDNNIDRSIGPVLLACICALATINDDATTDSFISLLYDAQTPYNQLSEKLTLFLTELQSKDKIVQDTTTQDDAVYTDELQGLKQSEVNGKLPEDTGVKILVRPCLVYGAENFQSKDLPGMNEVLRDCSWACKDPCGYCLCHPSTFGPLAGCVTTRNREGDK